MTTLQLLAIAASLIALLLGVIGTLTVRWMNRVELNINNLLTTSKTSAIKESELRGCIRNLGESVTRTDRSVGALSASVSKVWDVMLIQGLVGERESDTTMKNSS